MRIVVTTCDAHYQVVELFLKYWFRAWPECTYHVKVVTNTIAVPVPLDLRDQVSVMYLGLDEGWSSNMLDYVESIPGDDPFILMLEDYLVTELDLCLMEQAVETMERYPTVGQVRLVPIPGPQFDPKRHERIGRLNKEDPYAISLQAAIWRPQVLRDLLVRGESPWKFETLGSRRARTYDKYHFFGTYDYALRYVNYLRRGVPRESAMKWVEAHP